MPSDHQSNEFVSYYLLPDLSDKCSNRWHDKAFDQLRDYLFPFFLDYASLAETSVFNLVDESSTTVAPLVHHRKPVTPNVLPVAIPLAPNGNTAGPSVSLLRAPSQPNLEDTLPGYSEDAHVSTSRSSTHAISGSGQSRGAHCK